MPKFNLGSYRAEHSKNGQLSETQKNEIRLELLRLNGILHHANPIELKKNDPTGGLNLIIKCEELTKQVEAQKQRQHTEREADLLAQADSPRRLTLDEMLKRIRQQTAESKAAVEAAKTPPAPKHKPKPQKPRSAPSVTPAAAPAPTPEATPAPTPAAQTTARSHHSSVSSQSTRRRRAGRRRPQKTPEQKATEALSNLTAEEPQNSQAVYDLGRYIKENRSFISSKVKNAGLLLNILNNIAGYLSFNDLPAESAKRIASHILTQASTNTTLMLEFNESPLWKTTRTEGIIFENEVISEDCIYAKLKTNIPEVSGLLETIDCAAQPAAVDPMVEINRLRVRNRELSKKHREEHESLQAELRSAGVLVNDTTDSDSSTDTDNETVDGTPPPARTPAAAVAPTPDSNPGGLTAAAIAARPARAQRDATPTPPAAPDVTPASSAVDTNTHSDAGTVDLDHDHGGHTMPYNRNNNIKALVSTAGSATDEGFNRIFDTAGEDQPAFLVGLCEALSSHYESLPFRDARGAHATWGRYPGFSVALTAKMLEQLANTRDGAEHKQGDGTPDNDEILDAFAKMSLYLKPEQRIQVITKILRQIPEATDTISDDIAIAANNALGKSEIKTQQLVDLLNLYMPRAKFNPRSEQESKMIKAVTDSLSGLPKHDKKAYTLLHHAVSPKFLSKVRTKSQLSALLDAERKHSPRANVMDAFVQQALLHFLDVVEANFGIYKADLQQFIASHYADLLRHKDDQNPTPRDTYGTACTITRLLTDHDAIVTLARELKIADALEILRGKNLSAEQCADICINWLNNLETVADAHQVIQFYIEKSNGKNIDSVITAFLNKATADLATQAQLLFKEALKHKGSGASLEGLNNFLLENDPSKLHSIVLNLLRDPVTPVTPAVPGRCGTPPAGLREPSPRATYNQAVPNIRGFIQDSDEPNQERAKALHDILRKNISAGHLRLNAADMTAFTAVDDAIIAAMPETQRDNMKREMARAILTRPYILIANGTDRAWFLERFKPVLQNQIQTRKKHALKPAYDEAAALEVLLSSSILNATTEEIEAHFSHSDQDPTKILTDAQFTPELFAKNPDIVNPIFSTERADQTIHVMLLLRIAQAFELPPILAADDWNHDAFLDQCISLYENSEIPFGTDRLVNFKLALAQNAGVLIEHGFSFNKICQILEHESDDQDLQTIVLRQLESRFLQRLNAAQSCADAKVVMEEFKHIFEQAERNGLAGASRFFEGPWNAMFSSATDYTLAHHRLFIGQKVGNTSAFIDISDEERARLMCAEFEAWAMNYDTDHRVYSGSDLATKELIKARGFSDQTVDAFKTHLGIFAEHYNKLQDVESKRQFVETVLKNARHFLEALQERHTDEDDNSYLTEFDAFLTNTLELDKTLLFNNFYDELELLSFKTVDEEDDEKTAENRKHLERLMTFLNSPIFSDAQRLQAQYLLQRRSLGLFKAGIEQTDIVDAVNDEDILSGNILDSSARTLDPHNPTVSRAEAQQYFADYLSLASDLNVVAEFAINLLACGIPADQFLSRLDPDFGTEDNEKLEQLIANTREKLNDINFDDLEVNEFLKVAKAILTLSKTKHPRAEALQQQLSDTVRNNLPALIVSHNVALSDIEAFYPKFSVSGLAPEIQTAIQEQQRERKLWEDHLLNPENHEDMDDAWLDRIAKAKQLYASLPSTEQERVYSRAMRDEITEPVEIFKLIEHRARVTAANQRDFLKNPVAVCEQLNASREKLTDFMNNEDVSLRAQQQHYLAALWNEFTEESYADFEVDDSDSHVLIAYHEKVAAMHSNLRASFINALASALTANAEIEDDATLSSASSVSTTPEALEFTPEEAQKLAELLADAVEGQYTLDAVNELSATEFEELKGKIAEGEDEKSEEGSLKSKLLEKLNATNQYAIYELACENCQDTQLRAADELKAEIDQYDSELSRLRERLRDTEKLLLAGSGHTTRGRTMQEKFNFAMRSFPDLNQAEAEFLIKFMDRNKDKFSFTVGSLREDALRKELAELLALECTATESDDNKTISALNKKLFQEPQVYNKLLSHFHQSLERDINETVKQSALRDMQIMQTQGKSEEEIQARVQQIPEECKQRKALMNSYQNALALEHKISRRRASAQKLIESQRLLHQRIYQTYTAQQAALEKKPELKQWHNVTAKAQHTDRRHIPIASLQNTKALGLALVKESKGQDSAISLITEQTRRSDTALEGAMIDTEQGAAQEVRSTVFGGSNLTKGVMIEKRDGVPADGNPSRRSSQSMQVLIAQEFEKGKTTESSLERIKNALEIAEVFAQNNQHSKGKAVLRIDFDRIIGVSRGIFDFGKKNRQKEAVVDTARYLSILLSFFCENLKLDIHGDEIDNCAPTLENRIDLIHDIRQMGDDKLAAYLEAVMLKNQGRLDNHKDLRDRHDIRVTVPTEDMAMPTATK